MPLSAFWKMPKEKLWRDSTQLHKSSCPTLVVLVCDRVGILIWRVYAAFLCFALILFRDLLSTCPGRSSPGLGRSALHHGVLLQSAMGASAGISATLPQESLSAAQEDRRKWAHALGQN